MRELPKSASAPYTLVALQRPRRAPRRMPGDSGEHDPAGGAVAAVLRVATVTVSRALRGAHRALLAVEEHLRLVGFGDRARREEVPGGVRGELEELAGRVGDL